MVRQHILKERNQHEDVYDQHAHGTMYDVGDKVWLHCPAVPKGHCRKFHRPWQGPFTIVKVINSTVYRIQSNTSPCKRLVVHYNRLKPYFPPFNKDMFGSSPVPTQNESVHTSTQLDDNTDQQNENAMSDTTPQATEPAIRQQNLPATASTSPDPDPPLR